MKQVPQNHEKARHLSSDILRTSKKIQALYSKEKELMESTEELKESLQELNQWVT